jgi:CBS domain-containing protein
MLISNVLSHKGPDVIKVRATDTVASAVKKLAEYRIGAVIVEDDWMHRVGIFSERDFVNATARDGAGVLNHEVKELMSAPIISCRPSDSVNHVMAQMTMRRIRHMPVIESDQLVGIVSIGDLVKHRLDEKELEAAMLLDLSRMRA